MCVSYFFILRKFLCLGNPLMCLADKTAMQLPLAKAPVSNGKYLFILNNMVA